MQELHTDHAVDILHQARKIGAYCPAFRTEVWSNERIFSMIKDGFSLE